MSTDAARNWLQKMAHLPIAIYDGNDDIQYRYTQPPFDYNFRSFRIFLQQN